MKSWAMGLCALLASVCAGTSFGETVSVSLLSSPNPGLTGSLSVTAIDGASQKVITSQGAFKWSVNSDTGSTFANNVANNIPLYTFCIQAFQTTGTSYTVGNLGNGAPFGGVDAGVIDALAAAQIQGLVDRYWNAIDFTKTNGTNYTFNSVAYTDDQVAAAFQISVWEIEYDGGNGGEAYTFGGSKNFFTGGNLSASKIGNSTELANGQAALNLANGWLNHITADNTVSSFALESSYKQDQLVGIVNPSGSASPTPLPAALPGGLALMAGLGIYRKIRSKKS